MKTLILAVLLSTSFVSFNANAYCGSHSECSQKRNEDAERREQQQREMRQAQADRQARQHMAAIELKQRELEEQQRRIETNNRWN